MRRLLFVASTLIFVASCQRHAEISPAQPEVWKPIFFTAIDRLTEQLSLSKLRDSSVDPDDIELRIWIGFGLARLQGIRIQRQSDQWSAHYLREAADGLSGTISEKHPRNGWVGFWITLKNSGILSLPDQSELEGVVDVLDGESYVVEYAVDSRYRTYMYSNPDWQRGSEAKQMLRIIRTIRSELLMQTGPTSPVEASATIIDHESTSYSPPQTLP